MREVDVAKIIDQGPISLLQWRVIGLCFVVAGIDGFDTQAIAYVGKAVSTEIGVGAAKMGMLYSSGLFGLMVGALGLGWMADRLGRKRVIMICCGFMAVFALLTAVANSLEELIIYRFLTGLGLGGAMPNLNAVTAEYSPKKKRAFILTVMFSGFSVGAILGALVSPPLIEEFGWRSVFIVGGVAPLVMVVVLGLWMPESILFKILRDPNDPAIKQILSKMRSDYSPQDDDHFVTSETSGKPASPLMLFENGRTLITIGFWLTSFCYMLTMYALYSWLPSIMESAGLSRDKAIYTSGMISLGATLGGLFFGYMIDRYQSYRALPISYMIGGFACIVMGVMVRAPDIGPLFINIFVLGFFFASSQYLLNAFMVSIYETRLRSTGLGWALGVGRIGAVAGPIVVGNLMAMGASRPAVFFVLSAPVFMCAIIVLSINMYLSVVKRARTSTA